MIISGKIETVHDDNRGNKTHEICSRQNELLKLLALLNLDLVAKKKKRASVNTLCLILC